MNVKNKDVSIVVKSSAWYTVSSFITKAMGFITTPIFARILSTEDFGKFYVFANWQSLFAIFCGLEVVGTFNRARFDYKDENDFNSYISSCLVLTTIVTGTLMGFFLIFPTFFEMILSMNRKYIFFMFIYLLFLPAISAFQTKQGVLFRYKINTVISFFSVLTCSSLALICANLYTSDRLLGRILGQYMPIVGFGIIFYVIIIRTNRNIRIKNWKYALSLSGPLIFASASGLALISCDKFIVERMCDPDALAQVGIIATCSHIMTIFTGCLDSAWSPWYYNKLSTKEYSELKKGYKVYTLFLLYCITWGILLGPEILTILGGDKYKNALVLLPPCMMMSYPIMLINQMCGIEVFNKKSGRIAILTTVVALFNITMDIIGIKYISYITVTYVTVLGYILLLILHMIVSRKLGYNKYLPVSFIFFTVLFSVALMFVGLILYKFTIVRWGVIGLMAIATFVVMYIKRQSVVGFLKKVLKKD